MTPSPVRRHVILAGHRDGLLARGEEVLSRGDYLVTPVSTLEGLDALPALPAADLVVLDEGFGPEGGVRAAQHLRTSPRWMSTSIMVVVPSGSTHLEECLVSGINDFLLAPFPDGELLDKVRRLTEVAVRREVNTMLRVHEVRAEGMTVHGKTLNVSVNGLLAEVDGELNVGRVVDVEFFLPNDADSVRSRGQVARRAYEASSFRPVFGLRFLELSARDRGRIGRFVTSRERASGAGR
ncbi:MAG TPA: PilZ domain-containing protein [Thermoanaerobaculia bacterium]|nr:PilZ domain-containing protein [Thermoanaerobaculia bacterium]